MRIRYVVIDMRTAETLANWFDSASDAAYIAEEMNGNVGMAIFGILLCYEA